MPPFANSFSFSLKRQHSSLHSHLPLYKRFALSTSNAINIRCSGSLPAGRQHIQQVPNVRSSSRLARLNVIARSNGQPPGSGSGQYSRGKGERTEVVPVPANQQAPAFGSLERQIASNLTTAQPGLRDDWREVLGCWVLGPPAAAGMPSS